MTEKPCLECGEPFSSMQTRHRLISNLNREGLRYEQLARRRFAQAKISPVFKGQLIAQGIEYKLAADQLRLEADRLLRDVLAVVLN